MRRTTRLIAAGLLASLLAIPAPDHAPAAASGFRTVASTHVSGQHQCEFNHRLRCGHISVRLDPKHPAQGRLPIHYLLVPRRDKTRPSLGTIVAVEGGPGYATTASRGYYRDLFQPMLDRRQLLLVDQRGTGHSGVIKCPELQSYRGNRIQAIGLCGRQLGSASDLYGSAFAARDLAAVLDHLGIDKIDLYGDSYGTFFSQAFAVRYPERVRTLTLDASYFVGGTDPWYSDTNRALRDAFTFACERSPTCASRPARPMHRIAALADALRRHPISGRAPNAEGVVRKTVVNDNRLILLLTGAATSPTVYRELDAAARAALRPRPYDKPLLRLAREVLYVGGAGPYREYSEGMYLAVSCNDYPQPFDVTSPTHTRRAQFNRSVARLRRDTPHLFAPFTVKEWVRSPYGYYDDCMRWPAPSRLVPAVPVHAHYPDVPTLVFNGDLDSLTSPEGGRVTADHFPNSTFVETANMGHVSALIDFNQCASVIVRRFVRTRDPGDTSCAHQYHENRLVERFVPTARETGWGGPVRRTARVANATLADVMARWWQMYGRAGVGLRGGTFTLQGGAFSQPHPVVTWTLHQVRWVRDVAVSGTMRWHRRSGLVVAHVRTTGSGARPGRLRISWNDSARRPDASADGRLAGERVSLTFPSA